jgi:hypothetical protein
MTQGQYQREQAQNQAALTKAKGRRLLEQSYEARAIMAKYTNRAIAERHRQTAGMVSDMRNGYDPVKMPALTCRRIRMDLMRHDDAAKRYMSLDAIADHLNVGRSTVRKWAREFGFANEGQDQKRPPRPAKPVALRWPGTPMGKFAVMRLSRNPADVRTYY